MLSTQGVNNRFFIPVILYLICLSEVFLNTPLQGQLIKEHNIGRIIDTYKDQGSLLFKDKYAKMEWKDQGDLSEPSIMGRGVWIGSKNFTDELGVFNDYSVNKCGPYTDDEGIRGFIEMYRRYQKPIITVDDATTKSTEAIDQSIIIDPDLVPEESIVAQWKTKMGVTFTLTTYAYSQSGHDMYIIQDYVLQNTGDIDEDQEPELNAALKDFWFALTFMGRIGKNARDDLYAYVGRDFASGGDPFRLLYQWDADASSVPGNDWGDPSFLSDPVTFHQQYMGFALLHADAHPHAPGEVVEDDVYQPATVNIEPDRPPRHGTSGSDQILYEAMSAGTIVADAADLGLTEWTSSNSWALLGFGPYPDFPVGHEIRIVIVAALGGVDNETLAEIGKQELAGTITTEDRINVIKTGKDSLFSNVRRAKEAFENDYNLSDPPPPPDSLSVISKGGYVLIQWSDTPRHTLDMDSGQNDFSGYRVYRSIGRNEGPFTLIKTITREQLESGTETTQYKDYDVGRAIVYYYRVTSYDDGSQNAGISLESNTICGNTALGVTALSEPVHSSNQLKHVRVIPNPYNIFGVMNFPGEALQQNKLVFANLPEICTIRIFTITGDLVKTIEHYDGSGDEEWDQITNSNQFIMSGIYLAHIDSDLGEQVVKFIVVR